MPEFVMPLDNQEQIDAYKALDDFTQGYVEAMFFTETGDGDDGDLEDATFGDLAPEALAEIVDYCARFQARHAALLDRAYIQANYDATRAGRDLWFTSNGHGVGFWDRAELDDGQGLGDELSAACGFKTEFSERDIYRGDDGKVYFTHG